MTQRTREDVSRVIKAYDVRGLVDEEVTPEFIRDVGAAFAVLLRAEGETRIAVGHDMRPSSPELAAAFSEGARAQGLDVVMLGLNSTDQLYFAAGTLDCAGAMFTASHNPAEYNGIKLCRSGARPVSQDTGLSDIIDMLVDGVPAYEGAEGVERQRDTLEVYGEYLRDLVDLHSIRPLVVAVDAANGMAGHTVPEVFKGLPLDVRALYFELDGTFPNHEANPLDPANLVDLQKFTVEQHADIGLAFDGDADRCLVVDENGEAMDGDQIMLICALELMKRNKLHDNMLVTTVMSNVGLHQAMKAHGGKTVKTAVGDRYVLEEMLKHNYSIGGEQSGHIIFSEFAKTGDGILTAVQLLCAMVRNNKPLSEMGAVMTKFPQILLNVRVKNKNGWEEKAAIQEVIKKCQEELGENGQILVRASGTEPLIRIMAEGPKQERLEQIANAIADVVTKELA